MNQTTNTRSAIDAIAAKIAALESELAVETAKRHAELSFSFEEGRVKFEEELLRRHKALKVKLLPYIANADPMMILTAPFIYAVAIPLVLLDVFVTAYQAVCFPVYRIPKVRREDYLVFDRGHLSYLNALQKFNCGYCSYANGLIAYTREIASRTELYWCPIKHARKVAGAHERYHQFADYGDAEGFKAHAQSHKA